MVKPVLEKAKEYIASGYYLWNAGIFIWSAKSNQKDIDKQATEIHDLFVQGNAL